MAEMVSAAGGFDVTKQLQSDEQAANRGSGKTGGARNFRDGEAVGMALKRFDYPQTTRQGKHKVGIAFVRRKFASPMGAKS